MIQTTRLAGPLHAFASPATVFPREQKDNQDKLALRESSDFTICFQKGKHKTSREHHFCFDVNLVNIIKRQCS
ncbi:hypothetical protein BRADI_1g72505v3 [Brachypodium distachyon]|uniref:Uncharacterized protein n=1 Tax=Brachypodium distachyon TaxID=15368 RepID=A0A2K2DUS3_BRADI|nr:hypothetical protein BRADI_1g72505v3 [Brachypodium distachyon]